MIGFPYIGAEDYMGSPGYDAFPINPNNESTSDIARMEYAGAPGYNTRGDVVSTEDASPFGRLRGNSGTQFKPFSRGPMLFKAGGDVASFLQALASSAPWLYGQQT